MDKESQGVGRGLRLASMLIDQFFLIIITALFLVFGLGVGALMVGIHDTISEQEIGQTELEHALTLGVSYFLTFGLSLFLIKDIFNGRSPAKRMLKLQVVDVRTDQAANPLKCLIRNLTIPLWPLEVVFVLINPTRRIGDYISGTRINYTHNPAKNQMDWPKFSLALLFGLSISILITLPVKDFLLELEGPPLSYMESSLDQRESERINEIFVTELDDLIQESDIKYYGSIENDDRKYIEGVIVFTKESDYNKFEEYEERIYQLISSEFSMDHHVCSLNLVFLEPEPGVGGRSTHVVYDTRK